MVRYLKAVIKVGSDALARGHVRLFGEKSTFITCLFHSLFQNQEEINSKQVHPLEGITVECFHRFVEYFLSQGYTVVTPREILNGLKESGKYLLLTFDDGYFNNHRALPVLKEFQVPAVFFISSAHVQQGKCFWWDVLYRERIRQGKDLQTINVETERLKSLTANEIEGRLTSAFGEAAFHPIGDLDRPFTPSELKQLSEDEFVNIGNHTCNHAILTNYSESGIADQIRGCQSALEKIVGERPLIISYPNGNYSDEVIRQSVNAGLELGLTVVPKKNSLPLNGNKGHLMQLGRFTLKGNVDLIRQCDLIRSDLRLIDVMVRLSRKGY
jgi:peptidoglycan/xylan/chitin deacetylase (PgdA/CDA1 family)